MWSGNEIEEAGEELKPGHIRDSNRPTILALLAENVSIYFYSCVFSDLH